VIPTSSLLTEQLLRYSRNAYKKLAQLINSSLMRNWRL